MIKIPQDKEFFVSNGSDLTPNIQFTKNVDFDEEGYIKLSPPFPSIANDTDVATLGMSLDVIAVDTDDLLDQKYKLVTDDGTFDIDLTAESFAVDAGAPTGNTNVSRFVGWKGGDWYVNVSGDIYSLQTPLGTVWDIENTDGIDYAEVFINRNTLVGSTINSNVQQYTEANMNGTTPTGDNSGTTLQLPSNFEITGLAYSNYRIGVATWNKTGGSAYFFVWDGTTASANQGIPVQAQVIIDVVAYKNSWVILTSVGELLYFNGGGFDSLGSLPSYYFNANWIALDTNAVFEHGRTMHVDGDIIYINVGSLLVSSPDNSGILRGFYSGAWCFDPKVGLYHRYGIANSKLTSGSIAAVSGTFTSTAHLLSTGDRVLYTSSGVTYFAIYVTADTFKLADSYALAQAGTASSTFGTASYTLKWIKREDWAQLTVHNTNLGVCRRFENGSNLDNEGVLPFFIGNFMATKSMGADNVVTVMAPSFDNIGSVTYAKIKSQNIEDVWQGLVLKHRPLTEGDKIVIKYKIRDFYKQIAIGRADDISPSSDFITWVDGTSFTTTKDLTEIEIGHEVEFLSGAGAGATAHIVSATNNSGTWTVVVDETIAGGVSGNRSTCIFDSFVKLGTITATSQEPNNTYKVKIGVVSSWIQVKVEVRGIGTTIEEMQIINAIQRPSV